MISSEILAAASGKDVDLVITTTEGAVITLNGKEITDVSDFGVKLEIYTVDRKICVAFVNAVKLPGKLTVTFEEENVFGLTQTRREDRTDCRDSKRQRVGSCGPS